MNKDTHVAVRRPDALSLFEKMDPNFRKLVDIFSRQGHADPIASATKHRLVKRGGSLVLVTRSRPLELAPDNAALSVAASQRSYASRIGLNEMSKDEQKLFLSGQLDCSIDMSEVTPVASL